MPVPNIEELYDKLNNLSASYENDKRTVKEKSFIDKFGGRFNNDHNLGIALLNELDRRGVDIGAEAAIEAVDQMIDKLRTECSQLLSLIGDAQRQVEEQSDKINQIAGAVSATISSNPDTNGESVAESLVEGGEPPMLPAEGADLPAGSGELPMLPAEGAPVEPPAEGGEPTVSPAKSAQAKENTGEKTVVSDVRMKRIKSLRSKIKPNNKPVGKKEAKGGFFKPSAGMLAGARGD